MNSESSMETEPVLRTVFKSRWIKPLVVVVLAVLFTGTDRPIMAQVVMGLSSFQSVASKTKKRLRRY
jgi:hypothetical protein